MAGLFAHGCEKLRYKGEMQPSELLDPVFSTQVEAVNGRKRTNGIRLRSFNLISIMGTSTSLSTPRNMSLRIQPLPPK